MILDIQRRIAEVGRIRIGHQVPMGPNKKRPAKLSTFRLTSRDPSRIEAAARLYGGKPQEWPDAPGGKQWEVYTTTNVLNCIVPPSEMAFSQYYELWSGGGCQRRCNGDTSDPSAESIGDGPCLCDPEARECSLETRLSVMLADLPGLGVWRLDTSGYYAAVEIGGSVRVIELAAKRGAMLPARLRLDLRETRRPGQQVRKYAVPVLEVGGDLTPAQLLQGLSGVDGTPGTIALEPAAVLDEDGVLVADGSRSLAGNVTPVPDTVPEWPTPSMAEQAAPPEPKKRRGQEPPPATGKAPRPVAAVPPLARQHEPQTVEADDRARPAPPQEHVVMGELQRPLVPPGVKNVELPPTAEDEEEEARRSRDPGPGQLGFDTAEDAAYDEAQAREIEQAFQREDPWATAADDDGAAVDAAYDRASKEERATLDDLPTTAQREAAARVPPPAAPKPPATTPPAMALVSAEPVTPAGPATVPQNRKMHALFRECGLTDRQDRLIVTGHILGHEVATSGVLTSDEAGTLIETLEWWQGDPTIDVDAKVTDILHEWVMREAGRQEAEPDAE